MVSVMSPISVIYLMALMSYWRRKMKNDNTRELVGLSLYAALIIVTVQFIRIPFGPQFVH